LKEDGMTALAKRPAQVQDSEGPASDLGVRIEHVLQELRVVLPGTQFLLGFQFIAVFSDAFASISAGAKALHLLSLLSVCISIMLLMTPAAYHRIVNQGKESESFHDIASRTLLAAMAFLAFGLATELLVIFFWTTGSVTLAVVVAVAAFATFAGAWFAYPAYRRTTLYPWRRLINSSVNRVARRSHKYGFETPGPS
jgi:hypothetical protein